MNIYTFPTSAELLRIEQDLLPRLEANRPIFQIMPVKTQDAAFLRWTQKDNYVGLQAIRGLNGKAPLVRPVGVREFLYQPGVYGEHSAIDETELTERAAAGSLTAPVNIDELVVDRQEMLLQRRLDRIEQIGWNLLVSGAFSVSTKSGQVLITDAYAIQQFAAAVSWAMFATATPLADMRQVQLKSRGASISFGKDAIMYMNQYTLNNLLSNGNAVDLYGRRTAGLGTFNNPDQINQLLAGDNLPSIAVYEGGYHDDNGNFNLFIPDNKVVVVGRRPAGQTVAEYRMVRNANNPNMAPGAYTKVIDHGDRQVPRLVEVHDGHNGGPVIYYPSAVVVMSV